MTKNPSTSHLFVINLFVINLFVINLFVINLFVIPILPGRHNTDEKLWMLTPGGSNPKRQRHRSLPPVPPAVKNEI
jgi:hypothetical protein